MNQSFAVGAERVSGVSESVLGDSMVPKSEGPGAPVKCGIPGLKIRTWGTQIYVIEPIDMGHAKTFLTFVNFATVTDAESEYDEFSILNLADDTPVAHTVLPELAKFGTA